MSRPVDWSPVGLDIDPAPGDPVLVLAGGRDYLDVAAAIDDAASAMARLDAGSTVSRAVDAVMDRKEDVIADVRRARGRYRAAGEALVTYAGVLDRVQSDTLAALNKAIAALDDASDAKGTQSYWQQLADDATDPVEKNTYRAKATTAEHHATSARTVVAAARRDIDSAVWDRDTAARSAIDHIEQITGRDDLNDSWWDDWGSKVVAAIADIADVVSTIAGVLAIVVAFIPVVGTALAGVLLVVAAVAAIVSALANIALAATGERSWAEAGIAIASAALSVIGLGAAAKAATGLTRVALKAGARESLTGLRGITTTRLKDGVKGFGKKTACKIGFGTCFTAGTLVRTPDGPRPIENLRAGDTVWTRDLTTGVDVLETVEETFVRTTTTLFHLTIAGERITTTDEHPFMVKGLGWIRAADLRPGDLLVTADLTRELTDQNTATVGAGAGTVRLDAVETEPLDDDHAATVHNIHVHAHHTYYVLAGDLPVLVHNMGEHVSLMRDEDAGGHAIARHVGKSDEYLRSRVAVKRASTFPDMATAERVTGENIRANSSAIDRWLSGTEPKQAFRTEMDPRDGRVYIKAEDKIVEPGQVVTVLRRNAEHPDGYHVLTSYPDLREK